MFQPPLTVLRRYDPAAPRPCLARSDGYLALSEAGGRSRMTAAANCAVCELAVRLAPTPRTAEGPIASPPGSGRIGPGRVPFVVERKPLGRQAVGPSTPRRCVPTSEAAAFHRSPGAAIANAEGLAELDSSRARIVATRLRPAPDRARPPRRCKQQQTHFARASCARSSTVSCRDGASPRSLTALSSLTDAARRPSRDRLGSIRPCSRRTASHRTQRLVARSPLQSLDCALMPLSEPGGCGYDLLRRLRGVDDAASTRSTPVVGTSR